MKYSVVASSPQMIEKVTNFEDNIELDYNETATQKYPFRMMRVGESFIVPFDDVKEKSLRYVVYQYSREDVRKWSVIKWNQWKCYEIGRIA